MTDKIAEIQRRHRIDQQDNTVFWSSHSFTLLDDRAYLLAEVERLRADVEQLRDVLKIVRIDGPDLDGLVWVSFVSEEMTARAHVVVGDKNLMVARIALQFRGVQRKALEGAP